MKRTVPELKQAAIDAGFSNDPVTEEMITALEELNAKLQQAGEGAPSKAKHEPWWRTALCVGTGVTGIAFGLIIMAVNHNKTAAMTKTVDEQAKEISHLRELNATQMAEIANRLQSALKTADSVSQNSANAADLSQKSVHFYMTEFQTLLEQMQKARDQAKPTTAGSGPKQ